MPVQTGATNSIVKSGAHDVKIYQGSQLIYQPASTFVPTDITGLQLWLDASQETAYTNGQTVGTVSDFSGNALNFTGSSVTYNAAGQNGLAVFDLASAGSITNASLSAFNFMHNGDSTIFMVMNIGTISTTERVVIYSKHDYANTEGSLFFIDHRTANAQDNHVRMIVFSNSIRPVDHFLEPYALQNQWAIHEVSHDLSNIGDPCYFQIGNQAAATSTCLTATGSANAASGLIFGPQGSPNAFDTAPENIAEIVIYDKVLTAQERTDVRDYLNTKWNL